ncbi:tRNA (adenosine(37)-N6)-dimethylallyltransferase MiaA [Aeromicrobium sp. YIM 150415]|uniref:tRNA (adenosine(37)-N6)-dimethylallyltransferase MiaA n=1 Tax=Aeromicrobium sp. YIM 150415 TaxID=2803912 RepID=UPI0019664AD6|nr:tRNA (adenosine(37)-N6)-dimethylallyltransferase MiaA [Aeromicrobium sp. YIM 150415]MBM9464281.1 tRNA (adenosine(37)-N6)-dimethylallyltransferase MiaA [Aeromicrobium sp. YIM 150415]
MPVQRQDRVVVVVGPTASGKSALAVAVSRRLGGEVVNADAVQLFRGMDIGSAKVTEAERAGVRHHLLDVLDVREEANVAVFQRSARRAIDEIRGRGALPVLVGGSSLYVRAVIDPLDFPGTDPDVRARWDQRLSELGAEALHAELRRRDPAAAEQILPTNGRRIVRALEVGELTGAPFTATMPDFTSIYDDLVMIGLDVPRDVLDDRIRRRVDQMWDDGLVEEVERLRAEGIEEGLTASRALGYQQLLAHGRGEIGEDEAREQTITGTRRFARRQDRMFRKDPRVRWLPYDAADLVERAVALAEAP